MAKRKTKRRKKNPAVLTWTILGLAAAGAGVLAWHVLRDETKRKPARAELPPEPPVQEGVFIVDETCTRVVGGDTEALIPLIEQRAATITDRQSSQAYVREAARFLQQYAPQCGVDPARVTTAMGQPPGVDTAEKVAMLMMIATGLVIVDLDPTDEQGLQKKMLVIAALETWARNAGVTEELIEEVWPILPVANPQEGLVLPYRWQHLEALVRGSSSSRRQRRPRRRTAYRRY